MPSIESGGSIQKKANKHAFADGAFQYNSNNKIHQFIENWRTRAYYTLHNWQTTRCGARKNVFQVDTRPNKEANMEETDSFVVCFLFGCIVFGLNFYEIQCRPAWVMHVYLPFSSIKCLDVTSCRFGNRLWMLLVNRTTSNRQPDDSVNVRTAGQRRLQETRSHGTK